MCRLWFLVWHWPHSQTADLAKPICVSLQDAGLDLCGNDSTWSSLFVTGLVILWESWKSAPVVNAHLVDDPTIRQPGFTLPRQQWSLLNRFCTGQGHCRACRKTWRLTDTDLCSCGETQKMSHIVESCPLTKLNGGLSQLHSAAIAWLTNWVLITYVRRRSYFIFVYYLVFFGWQYQHNQLPGKTHSK